jgi:hypothetical protein
MVIVWEVGMFSPAVGCTAVSGVGCTSVAGRGVLAAGRSGVEEDGGSVAWAGGACTEATCPPHAESTSIMINRDSSVRMFRVKDI